jgi:HEAT repeat protein
MGRVQAIPVLTSALSHRSPLVRGYAASALGEIGDRRVADRLERALGHEDHPFVRVNVLYGLCRLGRGAMMGDVLGMLRHPRYRIRCAAASCLRDLANRRNARRIAGAVEAALRVEETVAARSSLEDCLASVEELA